MSLFLAHNKIEAYEKYITVSLNPSVDIRMLQR